MIDLEYLTRLIKILKTEGVSSYKDGALSLILNAQSSEVSVTQKERPKAVEIPVDESQFPPDLRTDHINSVDTILNWSSGSDGGAPIDPLAQDLPIES